MSSSELRNLEKAQQIQQIFNNAKLNIVNSQKEFDARTTTTDDNLRLPLSLEDGGGLVDPAMISVEVAAQLAFFRKLKFQYLEQKAKDQYIKIIVSDEAPSITAADNERQRQENEMKKQELKEAKQALAEMHSNIRTLSPLVEQDYLKAKALSEEAVDLARKILDTRLALTRLRQAHPHPRLTVPSAEAQLDKQVEEMQSLEEQLQVLNEKIDGVKEKVKIGSRDVERLRVQRADLEKQVKANQSDVEDSRVMGLYDWLIASLAFHQSLFSLESYQSPAENELHLVYSLDPPSSPANLPRPKLSIILLFVPNSRQLADAQVTGMPSNADMSDVIGAHVQANDASGLIAAVLARARAELQ
ncbi:hypothetical protein NM688_g1016 [Phlebia brevispora]|uniref:Uncharacterized protein n=1 Tax=Phlebia brevispora TaxID=194682 RepID=A0ACC1TCY0_9APHY|nr:hypothetical protein NM688_g1016 [Phlebia brevispora]